MITLENALDYHDRGFNVIPVDPGTKRPKFEWGEYQTTRVTESQVRLWFGGDDQHGIASICGTVSGDLICRDFDQVASYEEWAEKNPTYAKLLPTARTPRPGRHVWMRGDLEQIRQHSPSGSPIIVHSDGELRGGGYTLLPPSTSSRGAYKWQVPIGREIPEVDLLKAGLLVGVEHRGHRELRITQTTQEVTGFSAPSVLQDAILALIVTSTPKRVGERHTRLFKLARELKSLPDYADAPASAVKHIVRAWHQAAVPVIGTKDFEDNWFDFLGMWKRVRFPIGQGAIDLMFRRATERDLPAVAFQYENPALQQLIALCRELQTTAGDKPFFLDCRTAGRLIGVEHSRAWRWLRGLIDEGVIALVQTGTKHRASEYRYLHPLAGE